eukprot:GHVN01085252.1.p1 GENE.GHVN01085252.1~~GHVN01085252.1.p1  ORF type:complete len:281 (+),score=51.20 GHVN01085252.1:843-1685(+)
MFLKRFAFAATSFLSSRPSVCQTCQPYSSYITHSPHSPKLVQPHSSSQRRGLFSRPPSMAPPPIPDVVIHRGDPPHSGVVIFSHGLGDTSEGWASMFKQLSRGMPHVKFILPTAPIQRVTLNGGMPMPSWYDIASLDEESRETDNSDGIDESRDRINKIIDHEINENKIPSNRIIVGGFSQGGALSIYTALQRKAHPLRAHSGPLKAKHLTMAVLGGPKRALTECQKKLLTFLDKGDWENRFYNYVDFDIKQGIKQQVIKVGSSHRHKATENPKFSTTRD